MLCLDSVSVNYGKSRVVMNVSFNVSGLEKLVILGRNGVGKTTLLKSIIGLLPLQTGTLSLFDEDLTKLKPFERSRKGIAYVPQGREIIPTLTVRENLELGAIAHTKEIQSKMDEIFGYFPILPDHLNRKGGVLSGGQQQQLAIARALMSSPNALLLDEPTEGIQPNVVQEISGILSRYHRETKIPIVVVEQNLAFARSMGTNFVIMQKGSVVASGPISDLTDEMSEKYLAV